MVEGEKKYYPKTAKCYWKNKVSLQSTQCITWHKMALLSREWTPAFLLPWRKGEAGCSEGDWGDEGSTSVGSLAPCLDAGTTSTPLGWGSFCLLFFLLALPTLICKGSPQANIPSCLLTRFVPARLSPHPTPAVSPGGGGTCWAWRKQLRHPLRSQDAHAYLEMGSPCFLIVNLATAHCYVALSNAS